MSAHDHDTSAEERKARRLATIGRKGLEVAGKLEALLAGKDVSLDDFELRQVDDHGARKEARLRSYLRTINAARDRLRTDPAYGLWTSCGGPLNDLALDETPWLEHCPRCAAR